MSDQDPRLSALPVAPDYTDEQLDAMSEEERGRPDWGHRCQVCDATPVVPITGMCGPCSFGEAETANGNW